jgi:CheY-like chemotaxis protein
MQISPDRSALRQADSAEVDPSPAPLGGGAGEVYKSGGDGGCGSISLDGASGFAAVAVPGGFIQGLPSSDSPRLPARGALRRSGDAPGRPAGLRILLVEDHPDTAAALSQLLGAMGHRATVACCVAEALAAAARDHFDLVVSDIGLPDGDGHQLMRELSQRYHLSGVAVSGYGMEEDRRRSLSAGFRFHLTKPISLSQLQIAIEQAATPQG